MTEIVKASKNYDLELLKKSIDIAELSLGELGEDYLVLSDPNFKPVLNIGGYKFHFDESDNDMHYLLGGYGKKYIVPFDINNENIKFKIQKLGNRPIFKVHNKCILDIDNDKKYYYLGMNSNNFITYINLKKNSNGYEVEFSVNKVEGINHYTEVFIKYNYNKYMGKEIYVSHDKTDSPNDIKEITRFRVSEKSSLFRIQKEREGTFWSEYYTNDFAEKIKQIHLSGSEQVDLYFGDACANAKEWLDLIINRIENYDKELLELFLGKCPEIKDIMDTIYQSQNKGIIGSIVKDYFVKSKSLNMSNQVSCVEKR